MKNLKEILAANKAFVTATIAALKGLPTSADTAPKIAELNTQLTNHLNALPAEAPAEDTSWVTAAMQRTEEFASAALAQLSSLVTLVGQKATALHGFETQITGKQLVPAAEVTELCKLAKEDGRKEVMADVVAMRKVAVTAAKLPDAPDNILNLPATEFNSALTLAATQRETLTTKGIKPDTTIGKRMIWAGKDQFVTELNQLAELRGTSAAGGRQDPFLGNGGGAGGEARKCAGVF